MVTRTSEGPGFRDPSLGPPVITESIPCGQEYHEATAARPPADSCSCGTFAIGRCGNCQTPVCGDHSHSAEVRRCLPCWNEERTRRATVAKTAKDAEIEVFQADQDSYIAEFHAAIGSDPAPARVVCAVFELTNNRIPQMYGQRLDAEVFRELLAPAIGHGVELPPEKRAEWDDEAIARWFASHPNRPPTERVKVRGWKLTRSSQAWVYDSDQSYAGRVGAVQLKLGISTSGELLHGFPNGTMVKNQEQLYTEPGRFSYPALAKMASDLGFRGVRSN